MAPASHDGMPHDIARDQVKRLMADGAAIVEVLPREEFDREHLPGAISLPLDELKPEPVRDALGSDKSRPVAVYCQSSD